MKWCEHVDAREQCTFEIAGMKFCPTCGTPRPKEKSLAEKLREQFYTPATTIPVAECDRWERVAKVAEEHFETRHLKRDK